MNDQIPNTTRVFRLFRKLVKHGRQSSEETHELVELINNMAGSNVIERLEAKMDAQNNILEAKFTSIIWTIGIASGALGLLLTIAMFVLGR